MPSFGRPQVGAGEVAIVPTFKGFRKTTAAEVDGTTKEASTRFTRGFGQAGTSAGRSFASGFGKSTSGISGDALKRATDDVAKASRSLSAARLKEQDAAGKVRVAEAALADARDRYESGSLQVIRAEERLAAAQRQGKTATDSVERATEDLADARRHLAAATDQADASSTGFLSRFRTWGAQAGSGFRRAFASNVGQIFTGNFLAGIALAGVRQVGQAIAGGARFGFDAVQLASDLGESLNASNVQFGDEIAEQLRILGEDAPSRLALTRRAFQQYAVQFAGFARNIRNEDVAGFIDELTTRGADFASVYNVDVDEALRLFQSGLAGETEPLRRFGIDLSAASVQAYAYRNGIAAVGASLTEAERQQARYGLLLEQTQSVMGDNANTANELAGQQRRLAVAWEEAQTRIGEFLTPGLRTFVTFANESLLPRLDQVIDRVGPIFGSALSGSAGKLEEMLDKVAPLVEDFVIWGAEALPDVIDGLGDAAEATGDFFAGVEEITAKHENGIDDFDRFIQSIVIPFRQMLGIDIPAEWLESGEESAGQFAHGLQTGGPGAAHEAKTFAAVVAGELGGQGPRDTVGARGSVWWNAGKEAGAGFGSGLLSQQHEVELAAEKLGQAADRALRAKLRISSPSKVFQEAGEFTGQGYVLGLTSQQSAVRRATEAMVALPGRGVTSVAQGAATTSSGASSRPIYADGIGLIGFLRTVANGEARLVWAEMDAAAAQQTAQGRV